MNVFSVASLLLLVSVANAALQITPFIVGGRDSAKGRWPWQLSLQADRDKNGRFGHTCGAVLIDSMHALCAAHCFMFSKPSSDAQYYKINAGAFNLGQGDAEQEIRISSWVNHPEFSLISSGMPHDIAIIRFAKPADLSNPNIGIVKLASDSNTFAGSSDCWITGWGRTSKESETASPILKELNIPVLTNADCQTRWRRSIVGWLHPIMDVHICVGDERGQQSACQGDSGGPMSCKERDGTWVVAGVTSRGWPDCEIYPSVYTRVSKYVGWVREVVGRNI